ncbi:hypothetical protein EYR40_002820 [Pleurotus pulmonarius]|nr:hypothetical protein EYR40_002820 [Pleurotus pulmonarius]KAF4582330.1 hypothetical protein EYR38_002448 [Pleurotus pulmonarius]
MHKKKQEKMGMQAYEEKTKMLEDAVKNLQQYETEISIPASDFLKVPSSPLSPAPTSVPGEEEDFLNFKGAQLISLSLLEKKRQFAWLDNNHAPVASLTSENLNKHGRDTEDVPQPGKKGKGKKPQLALTKERVKDLQQRICDRIPRQTYKKFKQAWLDAAKSLGMEDEISGNSVSVEDQQLYHATVQLAIEIADLCEELDIVEGDIGFPTVKGTFDGGGYFLGEEVQEVAKWMHAHADMRMTAKAPAVKVHQSRTNNNEKTYEIYDYIKRKHIPLSKTMAIQARNKPEDYPGVVEQGLELAEFNNEGRCISCSNRDISKEVKALKASAAALATSRDHIPRLSCGCLLDLASLELWMVKITAELEDIPQRGASNTKSASFNFSEENLKMIAGVIQSLTGLGLPDLLAPKEQRLAHTAAYSLRELDRAFEINGDEEGGFLDCYKQLDATVTKLVDRNKLRSIE